MTNDQSKEKQTKNNYRKHIEAQPSIELSAILSVKALLFTDSSKEIKFLPFHKVVGPN